MTPDDPQYRPKGQAIERLVKRGAHFVRLRGKMPIERKGWQQRPISAEDAFHHLLTDDAHLAVIPLSLHCAVIDVDGLKNGGDVQAHNQNLTGRLMEWLGRAGYVACLPSLSNKDGKTGRYHLWYAADEFTPYPLGKKADGSPYRLGPSGMLFDGVNTGFDVRYDGYVVCDQYLVQLAYATRRRAGTASWQLRKLIEHGTRHKREGLPETEALFVPPKQEERYY